MQINLKGFTSTSKSKEAALKFAMDDIMNAQNAGKVAIIFEIQLIGENQYFSLNSEEYSAYPDEQEIVI